MSHSVEFKFRNTVKTPPFLDLIFVNFILLSVDTL